MAAFEVIALDTATPQLRAPGASDTYTFPRAVEMPLGTANGVLYLDGSKVVTSGSALTFDGTNFATTGRGTFGQRIQVTGNTAPSTGAGLELFYDGTVAAALAFARGTGYLPLGLDGSDIRFYASSSEQMRLTNTGLGIGTSSPGYKLTVAGGATSLAANQYLRFGAAPFAAGDGSVTNYLFSGSTSLTWRNAADSADLMYLSNSGNLGLGVTPSAWKSTSKALQIGTTGSIENNNGNGSLYLAFNGYRASSGSYTYIQNNFASLYGLEDSGKFVWYTAPSGNAGDPISFSQAMTLDASGNLGVGATSPGARLDLSDSVGRVMLNGAQISWNRNPNSGAIPDTAKGSALIVSNVTGGGVIQFWTSSGVNASGLAERARITSGGSLVVGTAALATTATDGFLYVPTCAGTPTGTPTTQTGTAPIVVDTTNNKLYFYSGGQWRDAGP